MARSRGLAVTPETARRIVELINSGPGPLHTRPSRGWGTGRHPMLVLCESSEAAGSSGVAGQVYPAVIIGGHATETTQPQFGRAWLTVLGTDADAVEPVAGQTYLAMRAGDFDPDPDGEESDPGPRVFSTVIGEGGGGPGDSPCDCQWIAALKIEDCLRFSPDGEEAVIAQGEEAAGGGSEAMADPTSVLSHGLILSESTTTEADGDSWTATVEICGVERTAVFIRTRYGPVMRLVWSDEYDVYTRYGQYCCQNGKAVFAFAKRDLCEVGEETACNNEIFTISVQCVSCPPEPSLACCESMPFFNLLLTLHDGTGIATASNGKTAFLSEETPTKWVTTSCFDAGTYPDRDEVSAMVLASAEFFCPAPFVTTPGITITSQFTGPISSHPHCFSNHKIQFINIVVESVECDPPLITFAMDVVVYDLADNLLGSGTLKATITQP